MLRDKMDHIREVKLAKNMAGALHQPVAKKLLASVKRRSTKCSPDKRGEVTYLLVGPNIEKEDLKEKMDGEFHRIIIEEGEATLKPGRRRSET